MTRNPNTETSAEATTAALLDAALDQMARVIAGTRHDQLTLAAPCTDWDVRALLRHIVGGPHVFAAMVRGERVDPSAPQPDRLGDGDPAAAFGDARRRTRDRASAAPGAGRPPRSHRRRGDGHPRL